MRSELRVAAHTPNGQTPLIEVWFAGAMVAVVQPAEGPGIRMISKFGLKTALIDGTVPDVCTIEVARSPLTRREYQTTARRGDRP